MFKLDIERQLVQLVSAILILNSVEVVPDSMAIARSKYCQVLPGSTPPQFRSVS